MFRRAILVTLTSFLTVAMAQTPEQKLYKPFWSYSRGDLCSASNSELSAILQTKLDDLGPWTKVLRVSLLRDLEKDLNGANFLKTEAIKSMVQVSLRRMTDLSPEERQKFDALDKRLTSEVQRFFGADGTSLTKMRPQLVSTFAAHCLAGWDDVSLERLRKFPHHLMCFPGEAGSKERVFLSVELGSSVKVCTQELNPIYDGPQARLPSATVFVSTCQSLALGEVNGKPQFKMAEDLSSDEVTVVHNLSRSFAPSLLKSAPEAIENFKDALGCLENTGEKLSEIKTPGCGSEGCP